MKNKFQGTIRNHILYTKQWIKKLLDSTFKYNTFKLNILQCQTIKVDINEWIIKDIQYSEIKEILERYEKHFYKIIYKIILKL
jgi:hypothetical protein